MRWRPALLLGICGLAILGTFFVPPVAQDPAYHHFADRVTRFGVANFWNVVSNLPFVLVGIFGLATRSRLYDPSLRLHYMSLCAGAVCIGIGSAYYHLAPSTPTLVWDRLPMTVAFMAVFTVVVGDRISLMLAQRMLAPAMFAGVASVVYWAHSETAGRGDLRPYALVQFLPMLMIPLMLILFEGRGLRARWLWGTLIVYAMAKLAEHYDREIFLALQIISGHSMKHLLAALALLFAVFAMHRRRKP